MEVKPVALITGASSGIGAAFARRLAAQGYDTILVARRADRLAALAAELRHQYGTAAEPLAADLAGPAGVAQVEARIAGLQALELLVNAAGFGTSGRFARIDLARQLEMIQLHVVAAVRLTRAALPGMLERHRGAIINVASVVAFLPLPGNVTYAGTKAFLVAFSETLQRELAGSGVRVQALCPGFTYSGFHDTAEYQHFSRKRIPAALWMTADQVAAASLKALGRGGVVYIPGLANRLLVAVGRHRLCQPLLFGMLVQRRGKG